MENKMPLLWKIKCRVLWNIVYHLHLVVMSMETYEDILASTEIDNAIAESEAQISSGEELLDAKEVLGTARRKYFG